MAQVLRIGRTAAYLLAQKDLANSGSEGLRVVRVGRLLRVPRTALEDLIGGPITVPPAAVVATGEPDVDLVESPDVDFTAKPERSLARPRPRQRVASDDQPSLPFAS